MESALWWLCVNLFNDMTLSLSSWSRLLLPVPVPVPVPAPPMTPPAAPSRDVEKGRPPAVTLSLMLLEHVIKRLHIANEQGGKQSPSEPHCTPGRRLSDSVFLVDSGSGHAVLVHHALLVLEPRVGPDVILVGMVVL